MKADETIANGRVFFGATAWTKTKPGAPDGMKVDRAGNLYGAIRLKSFHIFLIKNISKFRSVLTMICLKKDPP
ncbi:SMP-30/gluconolactonase/LRE family protein [candidate division KSB1 bacterium]|nr:SMP-30/gluconolactonase/LRE family protein [candidate division KSB1 bacterium]